MIPARLMECVRDAPDVPESRYGVLDWLLEYGNEDSWQSYLDAFPAHHDVRARFGAWLEGCGDKRCEGYRVLGWLGLVPRALPFGKWDYCWNPDAQWREYREHPKRYTYKQGPHVLPESWIARVRGSRSGHGYTMTRQSRRKAEDAAAIAFSKLSPVRRAELLSTNAAVPA